MLVLSRKKGEAISVEVPNGDFDRKVIVTVVEVSGNRVRLGVTADSSIVVDIIDAEECEDDLNKEHGS